MFIFHSLFWTSLCTSAAHPQKNRERVPFPIRERGRMRAGYSEPNSGKFESASAKQSSRATFPKFWFWSSLSQTGKTILVGYWARDKNSHLRCGHGLIMLIGWRAANMSSIRELLKETELKHPSEAKAAKMATFGVFIWSIQTNKLY